MGELGALVSSPLPQEATLGCPAHSPRRWFMFNWTTHEPYSLN